MRIKQARIYLFLTLMVFFGMNQALWAQTKQIKGTVTDSEGITLPGVTVVVKGTSKGVVTDFDGLYELEASPGNVLIFSYLGFDTQEVNVNSQSIINVQLKTGLTSLDEVTVIAYGTQKKITITGAVSSIDSEELVKTSKANVANSLAGKVTGLATVQYSGQPGEDDPSIFVRGVASLSEDRSEPLMIVDGVERSFMSLDPEEIESISILKDASATAVYGVRGANGVIIVTTRRGKIGEAKITASYSSGLQEPTRLLDFADSYTFAHRYNEAQLNDDPELTPEGLRFSPGVIEAFRTGSNPIIYPNTDWLDYLLKSTAAQSKGNVNISGGTEKVKYFVSLGALSQDGLFKKFESDYDGNFSFSRYNYRSNIDINVTKTTKLGVSIGGQVGVTNRPNTLHEYDQLFRHIYWSVPFSGPGLVDGKHVVGGEFYIPGATKDGLTETFGEGYTNILNNKLNLDLDLEKEFGFVEGLKFRTKFSYNTNYRHSKIRNASAANYTPYFLRDLDNTVDPLSEEIVYEKNGSDGNLSYGEAYGRGRKWYLDAGFSYNNSFGDHNVGGLVLYNQEKEYYPAQFTEIATGLVGLVGRVTYDFKNKYLADFNIGYNGSENFAPDKRFGVFPAFSTGWVVTNESFMENSFVNLLKFRISYGLVGNDRLGSGSNFDRFLYLPDSYDPDTGGYSFGTNNPINLPGASEGQIGNPDLTWETAIKQNYGVDLRLLDNKLGLTVEYFIENRSDILTYRGTIPSFVAYDIPAVNIGDVENKGYEVELKWKHRVNDDFRYWINGNMSHAKNKIVFMDEVIQEEDYLYRTGHPVGQPFGYIYDKFYNENDIGNDDLPDHQIELKPGDMVYKDLNGDGVIDQNDQEAIGYPVYPMYTFGSNLGFKYKNLDISMSWAGATHTSRLLGETYRIAFGATGNFSLLQYMADGRWTPETAETATYPRMTLTGVLNNTKDSDFWLRDASYVRLKNLEIGYNLKRDFLKKIGVNNFRAFINGSNLLTFDKIKITDPESKTAQDSKYPLTKVYSLGVKLNFL